MVDQGRGGGDKGIGEGLTIISRISFDFYTLAYARQRVNGEPMATFDRASLAKPFALWPARNSNITITLRELTFTFT